MAMSPNREKLLEALKDAAEDEKFWRSLRDDHPDEPVWAECVSISVKRTDALILELNKEENR